MRGYGNKSSILPRSTIDDFSHLRPSLYPSLPPLLFSLPQFFVFRFAKCAARKEVVFVPSARARVFRFLLPAVNKFLTILNLFGTIILSIKFTAGNNLNTYFNSITKLGKFKQKIIHNSKEYQKP